MSIYKSVCAALYMWCISVHLAHTVSSGFNDNPTLLVSAPTSAFFEGGLLHTFQGDPSKSYSIVYQDECSDDTFSIGRESGNFTVLRTIDFLSESQLDPKCVQSLDGSFVSIRTFYCLVVIQDTMQSYGIPVEIEALLELSNADLTFSEILYQAYVVEGVSNTAILGPPGLQINTLPTGRLTIPNYRITGDSANMFRIELQQTSCQVFPIIVVSTALSRERQEYYEITVEAFSFNAVANTTVRVQVLDTNDENPTFFESTSTASLPQDATPGTNLVQFQANDTDLGLNAFVRYSISPKSSIYAIHTLTGHVYLLAPLANYSEVSIIALDQGYPMLSAQTSLTIFIDSVNTFLPVIHVLGQLNVSELDAVGLSVANIEVRVHEPARATLELLNVECDCFRVSPNVAETSPGVFQFTVELTNSLDYESFPEGYHIVLTASDDEDTPLSSSLELEFTVVDVNEQPVFPQAFYDVSIAEIVPVDTEIIRVMATDPDIGSNGQLTYSMTGAAQYSSHFSIHASTGAVLTTMPLDFETFSSVTLFIVAEDSLGDRGSVTVVVDILDTNEHAPMFSQTEYSVSILETREARLPIFDFSASDGDRTCAGAVVYTILHAEPDVFYLDSFSGRLYPLTDSSLDFESFQNATVVVEATDLAERWSFSTYATLAVELMEVNDEAPVIDPFDCPCFITEGLDIRSCPLPSARDADSTVLTFSISSGNDLGHFSINSNTGRVSTTGSLDREEQESYILHITASDGELFSQSQPLSVIVMDVNDSPPTYNQQTIALVIPQDLAVGEFVYNIGATHLDAGFNGLTEHAFDPSTPSSVTNMFRLDPLSGDLYLRQQLLSNNMFVFTVTARDISMPGQSASAQVSISVDGFKNNPPQFPLSLDRVTVPQTFPVNTHILQLSAEDPDSGSNGALSYSLVGDHPGLFILMSAGVLLTSQSLFSAVGNEYHLNISATDGAIEPLVSYVELVITVYPSALTVDGMALVYDTSAGLCIISGSILERSSGSVVAATLPTTQEGLPITYSILQEGDFHAVFRVSNFEVLTEDGYDSVFDRAEREALYLTLRAQYGSFFHLCAITIAIEDTNDQPPRFEPSSYATQVYSDTPIGSSIFQVQASDADVGSNAVSVYSLRTSAVPFAVVPGSGILEVSGALSLPSYPLTIEARDAQDETKTATAVIEINVVQLSNSVPVFVNSNAMFSIPETSSIDMLIHAFAVTDSDSDIHGQNTFCIASGNEHNVFRIDSLGQLFVHNQLDFETQPSVFNLEIVVHDTTPNLVSQLLAVTVIVADANDETPQFSVPVYNTVVSENAGTGTTIIRVRATDSDAGTNGDIRYALVEDLAAFSIDPSTGTITTTSTLNREAFAVQSLNVTATDQAESDPRSSSAEVRIKVLDVNDNTPSVTSPTIDLPESTPVGSELFVLGATDNDGGANGALVYRIQSGNEDSTFSIHPWSGSITLQRSLDFETNSANYILSVLVQDLGTPPLSAISAVEFIQQDSNDNYPVFSSPFYNCSISEAQFSDFDSPCAVGAIDNDATDDVIQYSILSGNIGSNFIISADGEITNQGDLDREARPSYILQVRATDSSPTPLTSTAIVFISVTDTNDHVPMFEMPVITCPENLPINTVLFFIHATDDDEGEAGIVFYPSVGNSGGIFEIEETTGAVFLAGPLDYEVATSHSFLATASNPVGTSSRANITIQVMDINENTLPPFFPSSTPRVVSIPITHSPNSHVAVVRASDPDASPVETITYFITGGSGYGYFNIEPFSGNVSTSRSLTGLEEESLTLQVTAQDGGPFALSSSYVLTVILDGDPNAKPFFTRPVYYMRPSESSTQNNIIGYVIAEINGYLDPLVCYNITAGNDENTFAMNSTTGAISLIMGLNTEVTPLYNLTVQAYKPDINGITEALVIIEPADENDFRPNFPADFSVSIFENHPVGPEESFMRVFARDDDLGSNSQLTFTIENPAASPVALSSVSTGLLHLTSSLDSSTTSNYTVLIMVSDQLLAASTSIAITVLPEPTMQNNGAPVFTSVPNNPVLIHEDTTPSVVVATVQATDVDSPVLMYQILNPTMEFAVLPNSGEVYLVSFLDFESQPSYSLVVEVWDGVSTMSHILNIEVVDVNDNPPVFTTDSFSLTVTEHSIAGTTFGSVTATDRESTNLMFSLVDSLHAASLSLFEISSNGVMQVVADVDREMQPLHVLTVACIDDSGNLSFLNYSRVVVTVIDSNDNTPMFLDPLSEVYIPEDTPVDTVIYTVAAYDPDINSNADLNYNLQQMSSVFQINSTNGDIIITSSLDAEAQQEHVLTIAVRNPSNQNLFSSLTLTIHVLDVLDSTPILFNPGSVSVLENQPIYKMVTSVADTSNLRPVYYTIVAGGELGHFLIEPITGIIRTAVVLDRETVSSYELIIQGAFEVGYETNMTITVSVGDENDMPPEFPAPHLTFNIPENSTQLVSLGVTDRDDGINAQVNDFLIQDNLANEYFAVGASGNIMLRTLLDREGLFQSITFKVFAFDSGTPQMFSSALVTVNVIDSNDNTPEFDMEAYTLVLSVPAVINQSVCTVAARDPDEGSYGEVRYAFASGNGTDNFAINSITGEISVINNYQLQPYYSLIAIATDGGGQDASVPITILVKECGFNNLLFVPRFFQLEISENTNLNAIVFRAVDFLSEFDQPATQLEYSLSMPDPVFTIDSDSGRLVVQSQPDRETQSMHYLVLQARDVLASNRIAQADIEVTVLDVNDNAPQFDQDSYFISVLDATTSNTAVGQVTAMDPDEGQNGDVSYALISDPSNSFSIDEFTGSVFLISSTLDAGSSITLIAEARDNGTPQMSSQVEIFVAVVDSNAPLFSNDTYSVDVAEDTMSGSVITTVSATSFSPGDQVTYRIDSNDFLLPFLLNPYTGAITVVDPGLDYELSQSYSLNLLAFAFTASSPGQARLEIQVLDVNDLSPVFDSPDRFYVMAVSEDISVGSSILQVAASDGDSSSNAQISYQLAETDFAETFSIDQLTGTIINNQTLDYEDFPIYEFDVLALDSGSPQRTATATVRISTININDNPPLFTNSPYSFTILETAFPGTQIGSVMAMDADGDTLMYGVVTGEGSSNFQIDSNGQLQLHATTVALIGLEMIVLNISVSDGQFFGFATVNVIIQDQNDPPVFNQTEYTVSILEPAVGDMNVFVTQVFATDPDVGTNADFTYSLTSSEFVIDADTGIITTNAVATSSLDREREAEVSITVIARDTGGLTGSASVLVSVQDINDNAPSFLQEMYVGNVEHQAPVDTSVLTVFAFDPDAGENGTLSFSFVLADEQLPFKIDEDSGVISVATPPVFDIQEMYTFNVSVQDNGTLPLFAANPTNVTIFVEDTGTDFNFEQSYNLTVSEDFGVGLAIVQVAVIHSETLTCLSLEFEIFLQPSPDQFGIDEDTGVLSTIQSLDIGSHSIFLQAFCSFITPQMVETIQTITEVIVTVVGINHPPKLSESFYAGMIAEDAPMFTPPAGLMILATDNDVGDNATVLYRLIDTNGAPFAIFDPTDPTVRLEGLLDRENNSNYMFCIEAYDQGSPSLTDQALIVIIVTDVNDSPPVFDQDVYQFNVSEGISPSVVVGIVTVSDADFDPENKIATFSISGDVFSINSDGEIITVASLDRETLDSYIFNLQVNDGTQGDGALLIINVTDVNDNAPMFINTSEYENVIIFENHTINEPFVQVIAMDIDIVGSDTPVQYKIVEQPNPGQIVINATTGEISFAFSPDFDQAPRLEFRVEASDVGNLSSQTTVRVELLDVNDNAPVFTAPGYMESICEGAPIGVVVAFVVATDADSLSNGRVDYAIVGESSNYFAIFRGIINATQVFDRETTPSFDIVVVAFDLGTPSLSSNVTVHIDITDKNDLSPVFPRASYFAEVSELEMEGYVVLTLAAEDGDEGSNAEITYLILAGGNGDFTLVNDPNTGNVSIVVLADQLDHEGTTRYNLTLRAIDGGDPRQSGDTEVIIEVRDENDNSPIFLEPAYYETVPENSPVNSDVLVNVTATDRDASDTLVYSINDETSVPELAINSSTGCIVAARPLDYETRQRYDFQVTAQDQSESPKSVTVGVTIFLSDVNDNPPTFLPHNSTFTVLENSAAPVELVTLEADDSDSVSPREQITFSIQSGNDQDLFTLNLFTGTLTVAASLDREDTAEYLLVITADDNGDPSLTATSNITILVGDENDNDPTGGHQVIYLYLFNGVAPEISLGQVFVNDSDIINEHTYDILQSDITEFIIQEDASILVASGTPATGTYELSVRIRDAGNVPALTTINILVREVSEEALANSFSMQFVSIGPQAFVDDVLGNFLSILAQVVNETILVDVDIQVFAIQSSIEAPGNLDIFVTTQNVDGSYINPILVQHLLHINQDEIEASLNGARIATELVDLCAAEECPESGGGCRNTFNYSLNNQALGSQSITYLGLLPLHSILCERSRRPCDDLLCKQPSFCLETGDTATCVEDCQSDPCENGGKCIPQNPGYYCVCPEGYDGRNCEQTGATFNGQSYAVFESIDRRANGSITLEFTTSDDSGLIFFNGRFDNLYDDFIALELVDGRAVVRISFGGEVRTVVLFDQKLSDEVWHRLTVQYDANTVNLSVTTFDPYTPHNVTHTISSGFQFLDLGAPLIVGSLPPEFGYNTNQVSFQSGFIGCMRELTVNGKVLDFSRALLDTSVTKGCGFTSVVCDPNPCDNGGRCVGNWNSFYCDCTSRFSGPQCREDAPTASFPGDKFISYGILNPLSVRPLRQATTSSGSDRYTTAQNSITMSVQAAEKDSGTLLQLGDPSISSEYAILEIVNGSLQFRFNLGSGEVLVTQPSFKLSEDGTFHTITVQRTEQTADLLIDDSYFSSATSPGDEVTLDVAANLFYLGGAVNNGVLSDGFTGCIMGTTLDRKDVPVGGTSHDFEILESFKGASTGCAINVNPESATLAYIIGGAALFVVIVTVVVLVVSCAIFYRRHRNKRQGHSPTHNGFSWQPASHELRNTITSPHGNYRSTPQFIDTEEAFDAHNTDQLNNYPPSTISASTTAFTEPAFTEPTLSQQTPLHSRQESRDSRHKPSSPTRSNPSFGLAQSNPGFLQESPRSNREEGTTTTTEQQVRPQSAQASIHSTTTPPRLVRSPSGHQSVRSIGTVLSDTNSLLHDDDTDVAKYVYKRVEVADVDNEQYDMDEIKHFKDQGQYDPLGSIGSLYDFINECETPASPVKVSPSGYVQPLSADVTNPPFKDVKQPVPFSHVPVPSLKTPALSASNTQPLPVGVPVRSSSNTRVVSSNNSALVPVRSSSNSHIVSSNTSQPLLPVRSSSNSRVVSSTNSQPIPAPSSSHSQPIPVAIPVTPNNLNSQPLSEGHSQPAVELVRQLPRKKRSRHRRADQRRVI